MNIVIHEDLDGCGDAAFSRSPWLVTCLITNDKLNLGNHA